MTNIRENKTKIFTISILLIIVMSSVFVMFPMSSSDSATDSSEVKDKIDTESDTIETINNPKSSLLGNDTWWNIEWLYRKLINVTNPYDVGFENFPVKIHFNYTELIDLELGMNKTLKDIRIVENGQLRKYYFQQDYPNDGNATIWFETDIAKGPNNVEYDTYLYFGNGEAEIDTTYFMNESSSNPADAFGWIRNGDFEWEEDPPGDNSKLTQFLGWNYDNAPPTDLGDGYDGEQSVFSYEHGLFTAGQLTNQERLLEGDISFKWGDSDSYVDDTTVYAQGQDFEGTVFSYPFIVPTLTDADPNDKIYISFYQNYRTYNDQTQQPDGYLIRISDVSNYLQGGSDPDTFTTYQHYLTENKQGTKTMTMRQEGDGPNPAETRGEVGDTPPFSLNGDLTGLFTDFDITDWQGDCVFFEASTYGQETGNKRSVFAQLDDLKFNYELETELDWENQLVQTEITVITKDVDGRIIPNAEVSLVDITKIPQELVTQVTDDTGETIFSNIGYGTYNFTVNYTLSSEKETIVFDSTVQGEDNYVFDESESEYNIILILNMSTFDFEIVDSVGRPLNHGFVNIKESKNGESLENLTLDSDGTATFRWLNVSSYYYEVYYDNTDYGDMPMKLNESILLRSHYTQAKEKYQTHSFNVNDYNPAPTLTYEVIQDIYTNGSTTELANKKIINFTVTLTNMDNYISNVTIFYINRTGSINGNLIYTNTSYGPGDTNTIIKITLSDTPVECANLKADNYSAYGLRVIVKGVNDTIVCNGVITVDLVETWNEFNKTALARMNIRVEDTGDPIDVAKVYVTQGSKSIVNLSSYVDKEISPGVYIESDGWVFGRNNWEVPFWYLIGQSYNFTLTISKQEVQFNVNQTLNTTKISNIEQWYPKIPLAGGAQYNVTMTYDDGILIFDVGVVPIVQQTRFDNYTLTEEVIWGEIINVKIYYEFSIGAGWNPIPHTGNVMIEFKTVGVGSEVYHTGTMQYGGQLGWLSYSLNSDKLTAGTNSKSYVVTISADEDEYVNPADVINYTVVIALETDLSIHEDFPDYDLQVEAFEQFYGESINISLKYYDNTTKLALGGASVFYDWLNLGDIQFYEDPVNNTFYTVTLDTSLAGSVGPQVIKFTLYKENYTIQENILITLRILERPTYVNNRTGFYYLSQGIWVQDVYNFTFVYRDKLSGNRIGDANIYEYIWQKTDSEGNPAGTEGNGLLVEMGNQEYVLDFDTELKGIGYYIIYLTIQKDNYELRTVVINFIINIRTFSSDLDVTDLDDDLISVVHGKKVKFELTLLDESRGNIALEGATVKIDIKGREYTMKEDSPGVYIYTFDTDDVDAFFTSKTYTVTITIEKAFFADDEIELTLEVTMEEIFPGMPTFYFIMIVSAISAVIGSLVGYRVIQQARIPKFVKKVRAVKKSIKGKSSAPSISIPSKNKMFLKQFNRDWKDIGIDLGDILGIEEKKTTLITKAKDIMKQKGGAQ